MMLGSLEASLNWRHMPQFTKKPGKSALLYHLSHKNDIEGYQSILFSADYLKSKCISLWHYQKLE
jgi:hypothetical protein